MHHATVFFLFLVVGNLFPLAAPAGEAVQKTFKIGLVGPQIGNDTLNSIKKNLARSSPEIELVKIFHGKNEDQKKYAASLKGSINSLSVLMGNLNDSMINEFKNIEIKKPIVVIPETAGLTKSGVYSFPFLTYRILSHVPIFYLETKQFKSEKSINCNDPESLKSWKHDILLDYDYDAIHISNIRECEAGSILPLMLAKQGDLYGFDNDDLYMFHDAHTQHDPGTWKLPEGGAINFVYGKKVKEASLAMPILWNLGIDTIGKIVNKNKNNLADLSLGKEITKAYRPPERWWPPPPEQ